MTNQEKAAFLRRYIRLKELIGKNYNAELEKKASEYLDKNYAQRCGNESGKYAVTAIHEVCRIL